jgi:hypothetical protein
VANCNCPAPTVRFSITGRVVHSMLSVCVAPFGRMSAARPIHIRCRCRKTLADEMQQDCRHRPDRPAAGLSVTSWMERQAVRSALRPSGDRRPTRTAYRLFIRPALCRFGQLGLCGKTIIGGSLATEFWNSDRCGYFRAHKFRRVNRPSGCRREHRAARCQFRRKSKWDDNDGNTRQREGWPLVPTGGVSVAVSWVRAGRRQSARRLRTTLVFDGRGCGRHCKKGRPWSPLLAWGIKSGSTRWAYQSSCR